MRRPLALSLTLAVTGCGAEAGEPESDPAAARAVARAAQRTVAGGLTSYELRGTYRRFPVSGSGTVDVRSKTGRATWRIDVPRVGQTEVRQVRAGRTLYVSLPEFEAIGNGKRWVRLPPGGAGIDPALAQPIGVDLATLLEELTRPGRWVPEGAARVRGETAARFDGPGRTVFVGPGDLVRRLVVRDGRGLAVTLDLIEHGVADAVGSPPADQTMDAGELDAAASGIPVG